MRRRPAIQQAFDEARFGATRSLNVREPMLSGAEAVRRAEGWLRTKQVEQAGEVLVITGRGNNSPGQVGVVRDEIHKLLGRLRRAGVVAAMSEHTSGSFAVTLAPLRALFDAPARSRDGHQGRQRHPTPRYPGSLAGLTPETLARLRQLASVTLESLGFAVVDDAYVQAEMERAFTLLTRAGGHQLSEASLCAAIERALLEHEDLDG
ncbi:MAG: Smr/MutS family protein [Gemmatimonadaceae bacterium]|nr:Smr/MutS family protein [Gemmatimonadaceae bacterium]